MEAALSTVKSIKSKIAQEEQRKHETDEKLKQMRQEQEKLEHQVKVSQANIAGYQASLEELRKELMPDDSLIKMGRKRLSSESDSSSSDDSPRPEKKLKLSKGEKRE